MTFETWIAYLAMVAIVMITPGPSQLLMLSNSMSNGFRRSLATAAGDLSANLLQMAAAALGLASLIRSSSEFFLVVKWAGVAYLIYLGLRSFRKGREQPDSPQARKSLHSLYWQGFITSAANPKAIVFFAALFPQFISVSKPLLPQFVILSTTYLAMDGLFLAAYGRFSRLIMRKLKTSLGRFMNEISGSLLIGAALLLGLKNVERPG